MLDHTRRIFLVLAIFLVTGWIYKQWRGDHGGYGLFDLLKDGKASTTPTMASAPKLTTGDLPGLAQLSEESAKLAAAVLPSVVSINTIGSVPVLNIFNMPLAQRRLVPGLGSGVIVSREGHVITNFHVIKGLVEINGVLQLEVVTHDGKKHSALVIGTHEDLDIAVLRIKSDKKDFPALSFANSDEARAGQIVFAVGIPFGLNGTVTQGIISATRRRFSDMTNDLLQTDTVINPGNSGGPLVNIHGEIVGINVAIYPGDPNVHSWQGVGLAIPANDVREAFAAITTQGSKQASYLGLTVEENPVLVTVPTSPGKRYFGAIITGVLPGSPAAQAGLQVGDVIIEMDGRTYEKPYHLMHDVRSTSAGVTKELDIIRGDRRMKVKVTFQPRPKGL